MQQTPVESKRSAPGYEPPTLTVIGSVYEITKGLQTCPTDTLGVVGDCPPPTS
jgi:hypothetical protein